jgi:hypothetical protein
MVRLTAQYQCCIDIGTRRYAMSSVGDERIVVRGRTDALVISAGGIVDWTN